MSWIVHVHLVPRGKGVHKPANTLLVTRQSGVSKHGSLERILHGFVHWCVLNTNELGLRVAHCIVLGSSFL